MAGPGEVAPHVTGSNRNVQICTDISIYRKLPDKFPIDDLDSSYIWLFLGSGIKCHQCNSYDDYHCADPFYYADSPDKPKTDKFLKDCPDDGEDYFCRKIFQNGESVTRVSLSLRSIWENMRIQFELLCNIYSNSMSCKSWENAIPHQIISYRELNLSMKTLLIIWIINCW